MNTIRSFYGLINAIFLVTYLPRKSKDEYIYYLFKYEMLRECIKVKYNMKRPIVLCFFYATFSDCIVT